MYKQLYEYLNNYLNDLLRSFRKVHSTQHALFRLIQSCQCYAMSKFIMPSQNSSWKVGSRIYGKWRNQIPLGSPTTIDALAQDPG